MEIVRKGFEVNLLIPAISYGNNNLLIGKKEIFCRNSQFLDIQIPFGLSPSGARADAGFRLDLVKALFPRDKTWPRLGVSPQFSQPTWSAIRA